MVIWKSIFGFELGIEFSHKVSEDVLVVPKSLTDFLSFFVVLKLDKALFAQLDHEYLWSKNSYINKLKNFSQWLFIGVAFIHEPKSYDFFYLFSHRSPELFYRIYD